jgi:hypothetical protein
MIYDRNRIIESVRSAFRGVELGSGIGLKQGQELDRYSGANAIAAARSSDEKHDWSRIPASDLDGCYNSLSFFDADGMRFHLPAYLVADLEGRLNADLIFTLTSVGSDFISRFDNLNDSQRNAVRQYLTLKIAEDPGDEFSRSMIEKALQAYWTINSSA